MNPNILHRFTDKELDRWVLQRNLTAPLDPQFHYRYATHAELIRTGFGVCLAKNTNHLIDRVRTRGLNINLFLAENREYQLARVLLLMSEPRFDPIPARAAIRNNNFLKRTNYLAPLGSNHTALQRLDYIYNRLMTPMQPQVKFDFLRQLNQSLGLPFYKSLHECIQLAIT